MKNVLSADGEQPQICEMKHTNKGKGDRSDVKGMDVPRGRFNRSIC